MSVKGDFRSIKGHCPLCSQKLKSPVTLTHMVLLKLFSTDGCKYIIQRNTISCTMSVFVIVKIYAVFTRQVSNEA